MERRTPSCDARVQDFAHQARGGETLSVILQIASLPALVSDFQPMENQETLTSALPSPANIALAHYSKDNYTHSLFQQKQREQYLEDFKKTLKALGLIQPVNCNALSGTITLHVTPAQLKRLMHAPNILAISENKQRYL
jgi:hypothetical protein